MSSLSDDGFGGRWLRRLVKRKKRPQRATLAEAFAERFGFPVDVAVQVVLGFLFVAMWIAGRIWWGWEGDADVFSVDPR